MSEGLVFFKLPIKEINDSSPADIQLVSVSAIQRVKPSTLIDPRSEAPIYGSVIFFVGGEKYFTPLTLDEISELMLKAAS